MAKLSDAIVEAACEKFAEFGIDFRCPWQCDLDDAEQERYEALRAVLATALSSQEAEIAELRKALKPFANMAGEMLKRGWTVGQLVIALDNPDDPHRVMAGDFFAARAALAKTVEG